MTARTMITWAWINGPIWINDHIMLGGDCINDEKLVV